MNFLLASSRQCHPAAEWIAHGVKFLIDDIFRSSHQWALFDVNPDLLEPRGPRVQRTNLRSNSFHHQSVVAFSKAVIAGATPWFGNEMEIFFGPLAKSALPVLALGLEEHPEALSSDEQTCLTRPGSLVIVSEPSVKDWFRARGITATVMPNPALFVPNAEAEVSAPKSDRLRVGWILEPGDESALRYITKLEKNFVHRLICTSIDDFLKYATMFPNEVRYSYEALDYPRFVADCDVVVAANAAGMALANAGLRPGILLTEKPVTALPFVRPSPLAKVHEAIRLAVAEQVSPLQIDSWKSTVQLRWKDLLTEQGVDFSKSARRELWSDAAR